jgi:hypothetical protein
MFVIKMPIRGNFFKQLKITISENRSRFVVSEKTMSQLETKNIRLFVQINLLELENY